ncbi:MAG: DUF6375 family protein [Candidatus Dadabacteria bacterium]|nr:DUF6375 family protein [Candidatus Dadabacteria bacterium]MDE0477374.1 DUF6375 family protein [Candidatus Dadabacteria bacterium]
MKIWQSYGSEHSMNLVMIGRFKQESDAERIKGVFDFLLEKLRDLPDSDIKEDRFTSDVRDLLRSKNIHYLYPKELTQFLYDVSFEHNGNEIRITTDEDDVSAMLKIMLVEGAKVEVFSAHDYPESDTPKR